MVATKEGKVAVKIAKAIEPERKMTKEDLEVAAYFHWLGRGCPSDDLMTDWSEVEKKRGKEAVSKKMDVQA